MRRYWAEQTDGYHHVIDDKYLYSSGHRGQRIILTVSDEHVAHNIAKALEALPIPDAGKLAAPSAETRHSPRHKWEYGSYPWMVCKWCGAQKPEGERSAAECRRDRT